ncbi:MAG: LamG domain-containing protein [Nibricoccus sp.]
MPSRVVLKAVLFALIVFPGGGAIFGAGNEKTNTRTASVPMASAVWKLDGVSDIGGFKPEVLGSPQVVEEDGCKGLVFNGRDDGLILPVNPLAGWPRFTIEILIKPDPTGEEEQRFIHIQDTQGRRAMVETRITRDRQWVLDTYLRATLDHNRTLIDRTKKHPTGQWHWVALVYDGEVMTNYINGVKELEGEVLMPPMTEGSISIGVRQNRVYWYKGAIREVRFTREALKPASLQRVAR